MNAPQHNVDPREVAQFDSIADGWWDPGGDFKPLHDINPLRVDYIAARTTLDGQRVADVGCGGGLLTEGMAARGARALGIDMSERALEAARQHAAMGDLEVEYRSGTAEALADEMTGEFDVVTCLELLEHVPEPDRVVAACARLARPGGDVFFSTINRNPKAWALAVLGAEYLLRLLPAGTHDYARFIKPSELERWARAANLSIEDLTGMHYNPLTRRYSLGGNVDVNYLAHFRRG